MAELISQLSEPSVWDDPQKAQGLNKEKVNLEKELNKFIKLEEAIKDSIELSEIAIEEEDGDALEGIALEIAEHAIFLLCKNRAAASDAPEVNICLMLLLSP